MLRSLQLMLAALAMIVAPLAMQSGVATAAMPMVHGEKAQAGHCSDEDGGSEDEPGAMTQCCVAMCSALAPLGAAAIESVAYQAPMLAGFRSSGHRAFLAKLPTPPPKPA